MSAIEVDTTRLPLLLHDLRLPAIATPLAGVRRARRTRRAGRRHASSLHSPNWRLPSAAGGGSSDILPKHVCSPGKTLDNFDFSVVPMLSKARVMALAAGDAWLDKASNLLLFGPPGSREKPLLLRPSAAHLSRTATVCCSPAPRISSRSCRLRGRPCNSRPRSAKLDRYDLLILDDLSLRSQGPCRDIRAVRADRCTL